MADAMIAFAKGDKLPTVEEFRAELKKRGVELEEWDEVEKVSDMGICGCWPGTYKGEEIAFEFGATPFEEGEREDYAQDFENFEEMLGDRDYIIDFVYRTEADVFASMISICVLCKMSDAISFDDDDELTINAQTCDEWTSDI
jgi:hypothetical protein